MPPIRSRRPGARAITSGCDRSNQSARASSVAENVWGIRLCTNVLHEPAFTKELLQDGLDLPPDVRVRVADPPEVRLDVERRIDRTAARVGHDHTRSPCDRFGAEIVRMTAQPACASLRPD